MKPPCRAVPVLIFGVLLSATSEAVPSFRSAYLSPGIFAWTPAVNLPALVILDLGSGLSPLGVNDAGTVVALRDDDALVRVEPGQVDVLLEDYSPNGQAFINNNGYIAAYPGVSEAQPVHIWNPWGTHRELDWSGHLSGDRGFTQLSGLSNADDLILKVVTSRMTFYPFPTEHETETHRINLESGQWTELAHHEDALAPDESLTVSGTIYDVASVNTYGETIGSVIVEQGYQIKGAPMTYSVRDHYSAYNLHDRLDFSPMDISEQGTIVGSTYGPIYSLIIRDAFGTRAISDPLNLLQSRDALISSPADGMESIILGAHFWKRCSKRNMMGMMTRIPDKEFYQASLQEIILDAAGWSQLEATCISKEGTIAGSGSRLNAVTGTWSQHAFVLVPAGLLSDANRDGSINAIDRALPDHLKVLRLWINDDDDSGQEARSSDDDTPGSSRPDHANTTVDGLRDQVDFAPVFLDMQAVLKSVRNPSSIQLRLSQADNAFNFVYSSLLPGEAGTIHGDVQELRFGSTFDKVFAEADTIPVTDQGVTLSTSFVDNLRLNNQGVLFLEATKASEKPLVLEILRGGIVVASAHLDVSTGPVRDMFRVVNLRTVDSKFANADPGPWQTNLANPPNLPDSVLESTSGGTRTLIHIHGFNWTGKEIPAGHAEVFKRFYQAGSMARFIGVTWRGDQGTLNLTGGSFDYNENVINAFITASYLPEALAGWVDKRTAIFAHSLGNMVTSSGIVDFGLRPGAYFMLNAAVPMEAYVGESDNPSRENMVNPSWKNLGVTKADYAEFLLSANWSRLFNPTSDRRALVSWKNRFFGIADLTNCYNFYSSGEEILKTGDGKLPSIISDLARREEIWVYNEMVKGTSHLSNLLSADVQGGWGFNRFHMTTSGGGPHNPGITYRNMSTTTANSLDPTELIAHPFFETFSKGDSDFPLWGNGSWLYADTDTANLHLPELPLAGQPIELIKNHAKLLAEAIPAHGPPTGSNELHLINPAITDSNLDTRLRNKAFWPPRTKPDATSRWLHSDYLITSFAQCSRLYKFCVNIINQAL